MLRVAEEDRIPVSEIINHPWINIGYTEKVPSYLRDYKSVDKLDHGIIKKLKKIGFQIDEQSLLQIQTGDKSQIVSTYHLLLQKKKLKNDQVPSFKRTRTNSFIPKKLNHRKTYDLTDLFRESKNKEKDGKEKSKHKRKKSGNKKDLSTSTPDVTSENSEESMDKLKSSSDPHRFTPDFDTSDLELKITSTNKKRPVINLDNLKNDMIK